MATFTRQSVIYLFVTFVTFTTGFSFNQVKSFKRNCVGTSLRSNDNKIEVSTNDRQLRRDALRRMFEYTIVGGAVISFQSSGASALDMDAFMNQELKNDEAKCNPKLDPKCIPKLSADEALCKYGQGGNAKIEACKRVKSAGGSLPEQTKVKSLGGAYAM